MGNPTPSSSVTYQWNTTGCYTNSRFTPSNPECFPHGQTTQSVTGMFLNAEDAGTITCSVNGVSSISDAFILRISGEQVVYCVITCIVYCKQCMLLLLATCYCCIIHQLLWFMYRCVFTVGVAVTRNSLTDATDFLTDYSYVYASDSPGSGALLARCLTGLGPNDTDNNANSDLGGWHFNGNMIPNSDLFQDCGSPAANNNPAVGAIQARPGATAAGVINLRQCDPFTIALEGIYTCTMMTSSMTDQSVRLGVYITGRSESLDLCFSSLNHLSSLYTAAPVIDPMPPNTMTVNVGDPLMLSCTSQNSPPDTFTWRKDNVLVMESTSIDEVMYDDDSAVFRATYSIDSFTTSDSGTYTCTVTNPTGTASATIIVTVNSKLLCPSCVGDISIFRAQKQVCLVLSKCVTYKDCQIMEIVLCCLQKL